MQKHTSVGHERDQSQRISDANTPVFFLGNAIPRKAQQNRRPVIAVPLKSNHQKCLEKKKKKSPTPFSDTIPVVE